MAAPRPRRRDALANRERLLDEAERLFAEHGVDAQPHLLAERTGVGVGTLYRHFPTREDLVRAVYDRQCARITEVLAGARAIDDGWAALLAMIDGSLRVMVESPSFQAVGIRMARIDPDYGPALEWQPVVLEIVTRAHEQGVLRRDVTAQDVAHIPVLLASLVRLPGSARETVIARQRAIILDGLRADAARTQLPAAPLAPEVLHALAQGRYGDAEPEAPTTPR